MAYSAPPTKNTGDQFPASDWNTYLQANMVELESRKDTSYVQFTTNVATATTVEASATTIVTAAAVTANGTDTYEIEFFCATMTLVGNAAGNTCIASIFDGATQVGRLATFQRTDAAVDNRLMPVAAAYRLVPTAGSHTYSIREHHTAAACTFNASTGGVGANLPGYIRVRKVQ